MNAVSIKGLRFVYPGGKKRKAAEVLKGIDLTIPKGRIFGFLGPNGSGKTTLFKVLSTLLPPTDGTAEIFGIDLASRPFDVRRRIGIVFQNPSLDRKLSVMENLQYQGNLYGISGAELERKINHNVERFELKTILNQQAEKLSGGQKRRVELAKSLLHEPELLILDEPSTGLDPAIRGNLWQTLDELRHNDGVTVLVTTHLVSEAERCDELAIMDTGRVVAQGMPEALKARIGGEVLTIATSFPDKFIESYKERFGGEPRLVNGNVRLELHNAHRQITEIVENFGSLVNGVTYGKPTLEDVFVHETGRTFDVQEGA